MSKRSKFERNERDYYPTPLDGVLPLLPFLPARSSFAELCAGDGRLIRHLERFDHHCVYACDIEPLAEGIEKRDALFFGELTLPPCDFIITNPPWERSCLHDMIEKFRQERPTWLLFDTDWAHTAQAVEYLKYCKMIISIGRLKWIEGSSSVGMDNCAWYLFLDQPCETIFKKL